MNRLRDVTQSKIWPRFVFLLSSPLLLMVSMLPDRVKILFKENINVIRKSDCSHHNILLCLDSDFEYRVRLHSFSKEPDTVDWINSFFFRGETFFDIGANVGAYSLLACKHLKGDINVYAFEPAYFNFSQLCKNINVNKCQKGIVPVPVALAKHTRIEDLHYRTMVSGSAEHVLGMARHYDNTDFIPAHSQPVLSFSLDDFVHQWRLPTPNHIKIDIDGNELDVLSGMAEILCSPSLTTIMIEIDARKNHHSLISELLSKNGLFERSTYQSNYLFVREFR